MNVALFGGSFDPPHIGHEAVIKAALESLEVEWLLVVPAFLNPFKSRSFAPAEKRLEWMRLLTKGMPRVNVLDFEIMQGEPTPTIRTVQHIRESYQPEKVYLIIGADNLSSLHKWHRYQELKESVEFVVATREGVRVESGYKSLDVQIPVSSTSVRERYEPQKIPAIIAPFVAEYYKEKNAKKGEDHCHGAE